MTSSGVLSKNSQVRRREDVASRVLSGETETVLLDIRTGAYFGIDQVGTFLWDQLEAGPVRVEELTSRVHAAFPDAPDRVLDDVMEFLGALTERGLVVVENDPR